MGNYINPFIGTTDKKLTNKQLAAALRGMINEEFKAVQIYNQLIESTDDDRVKRVFKDVIREELIHVGEFEKLLNIVSPEDKILKEKGVVEAENILNLGNLVDG